MKTGIVEQEFLDFLDILEQGEETPVSSVPAVARIADRLHLGKLCLLFLQPPSIYTPQGEESLRKIFENPGGSAKEPDFVREYRIGEGGTGTFYAYTRSDEEHFSDQDIMGLEAVVHVLKLHGARFRLIQKVRRNAMTNYMTGLPNSAGYIQEILKRFREGTIVRYDAIHLNLRGFGLINRQFGGPEGDECVRRYSRKLMDQIYRGEVLAHFGGDNFTALIYKEHLEDFLQFVQAVEIYAVRAGKKIPVTLSAAVGVYPIQEDSTSEDIMTGSAAALALARDQKRDLVVSTREMERRVTRNKLLIQAFPRALAAHEFRVYYQPKVDTRNGQILGAEALVRWPFEDEILKPGDFIPLLEKNGHLLDLDLYVLRQVCEDIRAWQNKGMNCVPVSVNFSRADICGRGRSAAAIADMIREVIYNAGIGTELITIEVTETTDAAEQKQLYDFLERLRIFGMTTSVDDFGTGYSSLSILRDFPISEIKIDRSFINHESLGIHDEVILRNIINMAEELGLGIITEGVETWDQVDFLENLDCFYVQGFLFDEPLPRSEWESRLAEGFYEMTDRVNYQDEEIDRTGQDTMPDAAG